MKAEDARVQLAQLDFRLGAGVGAVKERSKLNNIIIREGKPDIIGGTKGERRKKRQGNPKGKARKTTGGK